MFLIHMHFYTHVRILTSVFRVSLKILNITENTKHTPKKSNQDHKLPRTCRPAYT